MRNSIMVIMTSVIFLCFAQSGSSQWMQANGPYGGSVICLAISGSSIYAGTDGGAYRSDDKGATWKTLYFNGSRYGSYTMSIIGNAIFAGTVNGLFKSNDGGVSWQMDTIGIGNILIRSMA